MNKEVVILIAEDNEGQAGLIRKNLTRAGIANPIVHLRDGQEVIDFLFAERYKVENPGDSFVLLLDIRMPKLDGIEVLKQIKNDDELKKIPVIMVTTTDDPREVAQCHKLGCNTYITKPVEYDVFVNTIKQLGLFLSVVQVPKVYLNED